MITSATPLSSTALQLQPRQQQQQQNPHPPSIPLDALLHLHRRQIPGTTGTGFALIPNSPLNTTVLNNSANIDPGLTLAMTTNANPITPTNWANVIYAFLLTMKQYEAASAPYDATNPKMTTSPPTQQPIASAYVHMVPVPNPPIPEPFDVDGVVSILNTLDSFQNPLEMTFSVLRTYDMAALGTGCVSNTWGAC